MNPKFSWINTISITFLSIVGYGVFVFAAPPLGGYLPGQTNDPSCTPGTMDCVVAALGIGQTIGGGTPNEVLYTDTTGLVFSDSMFTRNSVTNNTLLGKNFGGAINGGIQIDDNLLGIGLKGTTMLYFDATHSVGSFVGDLSAVGQSPWSAGFTYQDPDKLVFNIIDDTRALLQYSHDDTLNNIHVDTKLQIDETGSALVWDADTTDGISDRIVQGQNLQSITGNNGIMLDHQDLNTGFGITAVLGDNVGGGGQLNSFNVYASDSVAQRYMYSSLDTINGTNFGFTDSVNQIYSNFSLNDIGNNFTWNSNTVSTGVTMDNSIASLGYRNSSSLDSKFEASNNSALMIESPNGSQYYQAGLYNGGVFDIRNSTTNHPYFTVDVPNRDVKLGDSDGANNGTTISVNDPGQAISFAFGVNGYYTFPVGNAAGALVNNGSGALSW